MESRKSRLRVDVVPRVVQTAASIEVSTRKWLLWKTVIKKGFMETARLKLRASGWSRSWLRKRGTEGSLYGPWTPCQGSGGFWKVLEGSQQPDLLFKPKSGLGAATAEC